MSKVEVDTSNHAKIEVVWLLGWSILQCQFEDTMLSTTSTVGWKGMRPNVTLYRPIQVIVINTTSSTKTLLVYE